MQSSSSSIPTASAGDLSLRLASDASASMFASSLTMSSDRSRRSAAYAGLEMSDTEDDSHDDGRERKAVKNVKRLVHMTSLDLTTSSSSSASCSGKGRGPAVDLSKVLEGVYAYVEVGPLFDYEDLSDANTVTAEGVRQQLRMLGAKIANRFSAKITHVVMWRGREEIVVRARKRKPPPAIVSPNWLKMCFETASHVPEPHRNAASGDCLGNSITSPDYGMLAPPKPMSERAKRKLEYCAADEVMRQSARRVRARERYRRDRDLEREIAAIDVSTRLTPPPEVRVDGEQEQGPYTPFYAQRIRELMELQEELRDDIRGYKEPGWGVPLAERVRLKRLNKVSIGVNTDAPQLDHASQALPVDENGGVAARVHRRRTIAVMVPTEQRTNDVNFNFKEATAKRPNRKDLPLHMPAPRRRSGVRRRHMPIREMLYWYGIAMQKEEEDGGERKGEEQRAGVVRRKKPAAGVVLGTPAGVGDRDSTPSHVPTTSFDERLPAFSVKTRSTLLNDLQLVPSSEEFVPRKARRIENRPQRGAAKRKPPTNEIEDENCKRSVVKKRSRKRSHVVALNQGMRIVMSGVDEKQARIVFNRASLASCRERDAIRAVVQKLDGCGVFSLVDSHTAVVIGQAGRRTAGVIQAVVTGKPVVSAEWAFRSLEAGRWLPTADFLLPEWKTAITSRMSGRGGSRLFSPADVIFVAKNCSPSSQDLACFIEQSGGKTTTSLSRCTLMIASSNGDVPRSRVSIASVDAVNEKWLIDSIQQDKLQPLDDYRIV